MTLTFVACGPLGDCPSSYSTFAPSASVRKPSPAIPEKWTNASLLPSSGVMNPKPFSSLNHLTTPVAMRHSSCLHACARGAAGTAFPHTTMPPWGRPERASCTSRAQWAGPCAPPPAPDGGCLTFGASCGGVSYWFGSNVSLPGAGVATGGVVAPGVVPVVPGVVVPGVAGTPTGPAIVP